VFSGKIQDMAEPGQVIYLSGGNAKETEELCKRLNSPYDVSLLDLSPLIVCTLYRIYPRSIHKIRTNPMRSSSLQAKYLMGKYKFVASGLSKVAAVGSPFRTNRMLKATLFS